MCTTVHVTYTLQEFVHVFDLCRCHTFGIGSEVCVELVTGIAALSSGKCVLLKEGERLQTKVHRMILLYMYTCTCTFTCLPCTIYIDAGCYM